MNSNIIDFESKIKPLTPGNFYWTFEEGLNSDTCKFILDIATDSFKEVTLMGGADGGDFYNSHKDKTVRKGSSFFDNQQFVYDLVWPFLNTANKNAEWNFEISSAENYQIGKYEVGDFYASHLDGMGTEGTKFIDESKPNIDNKTRKMSMTLNLNDDYEGGDLILYDVGPIKQKKGNITFFPGYLLHEVTPVTKGTKYSLSMWFLGKPFK